MSEVFGYVKPPLEELRDLLPGTDGFDFGTSPHGLSACLPEPHQKTLGASSLSPPAKPLLTLPGDALPLPDEGLSAVERSGFAFDVPPAVRSVCRSLRAAVAKLVPKDVHYLRLTEVEFLHVYAAVDNDRSRTRKAIRKGIADPQDLKASDSLWQALQDVQARRLRKAWRLP